MYPAELNYAKEHEWVRVDGDVAVIGVSYFAQDQLGEVVYVDLPAVGDEVIAGEMFGEVESVKSVSELFAPVSGEVINVNEGLEDSPESVNEDPYGDGWMIEVKMNYEFELEALMSAEEYEQFLADQS